MVKFPLLYYKMVIIKCYNAKNLTGINVIEQFNQQKIILSDKFLMFNFFK